MQRPSGSTAAAAHILRAAFLEPGDLAGRRGQGRRWESIDNRAHDGGGDKHFHSAMDEGLSSPANGGCRPQACIEGRQPAGAQRTRRSEPPVATIVPAVVAVVATIVTTVIAPPNAVGDDGRGSDGGGGAADRSDHGRTADSSCCQHVRLLAIRRRIRFRRRSLPRRRLLRSRPGCPGPGCVLAR